jgi:autotransporter-associated beta strand protein
LLGGNEADLAAEGALFLGSLDTSVNQPFGRWRNATAGNFGTGVPGDVFQNYEGSWDSFAAANSITDSNIGNFLGSYGVDITNHAVWAVVNHNRQFAVVPEPSSLILLAIGAIGLCRFLNPSPSSRFPRPLRLDHRHGQSVLIIALLLAIFSAPAMAGTSGIWTNSTTDGIWSDPTNWAGGVVADGFDQIADFTTLDLTADNTVHLGSPRAIGTLLFGDATPSNNWTLDNYGNAANTLALTVSSGSPLIQTNYGVATPNAVLTGNQGLTTAGGGTLKLAGANAYTGVTSVSSGALQVTNTSGSATGTGSVFGFRSRPLLGRC